MSFQVDISVREGRILSLQENYLSNSILNCLITMKVGEFLDDSGFDKGVLSMSDMIALHTDEMIRSYYKNGY